MKPYILILAALFALASCVQVSRTDPTTGIVTKATITMSKGAYITVDGPVPGVSGYMPTTNKSGTVTGYKPMFAPVTGETPRALFAAYDLDQTDVPKAAVKAARDWGLGLIAGAVSKHINDNKTSVDMANSANAADATKQANALAAQAEKNRHIESMPEEVPTAPAP